MARNDAIRSSLEKLYQTHDVTVISSAKINKKVSYVLGLLAPDNSATTKPQMVRATTQLADGQNVAQKPVVVSLSAKSAVASKLITIVEIVKRELEARQREQKTKDGSPAMWQYTRVHGELLPHKAKEKAKPSIGSSAKRKRADSNIPADDPAAKRTKLDETISLQAVPAQLGTLQDGHRRDDSRRNANDADKLPADDEDDDNDDDFFEHFKQTPAAKALGIKDSKFREKPILTIWLSTMEIPLLADAYG